MSAVNAHSVSVERSPCKVYFEFVPYEKWSFHSYITLLVDNYENVDKMDAHFSFYRMLSLINDDEKMSQEVRDVAQRLLISKKTNVLKANNSFWNTSSPTTSSSHKGIKRKCLLKMVMGGQRSVKNLN
ncbi:2167_t:CDS:2 [Funneliformis caledonium]|uniref:2167_t:CDS:1 n=1 Tax=Funneliformis caledonium TaxID=1117310 RepID=A0A9N8VQ37_9GLOM|nr:2167_t:CDS:2 [Funneliformis caledonium]